MRVKIIYLYCVVLISTILIFSLNTKYPGQAYRLINTMVFEYLPMYSKSFFEDSIKHSQLKAKQETLDSLQEHLNPSSLNLVLTKIPKKGFLHSNNGNFHIIKYRANFLNLVKKVSQIGPAYIDIYEDKILIAQENGLFFSASKKAIEAGNEKIPVTHISTNITQFTEYIDFYGPGKFGVKDILVLNNKIYVSYIRELKPNCFNVSVLTAVIDVNLNFKILYTQKTCVDRSAGEINAEQSGARMVPYLTNKILLSIGDFRVRSNAQKLTNNFGKILSIDLSNGKSNIISFGHRNPQGLYFSKTFNDIWSTEHGPMGGDEVNINKGWSQGQMLNFGWPKASYGAHYGAGTYEKTTEGYTLKESRNHPLYDIAPLHKSHSQYGFTEPLLYLTPSVGISQIIEVSRDYSDTDAFRYFMFGTMGKSVSEHIPSLSLLVIAVNEEDKLISTEQIILNERMRDLIYDSETNSAFFSGDSNGVIGTLKPNKLLSN